MGCTAILFDLDGTLLDTLADIGGAANRVLAQFRLPLHDVNAYRFFVGDGVQTLFRRALPEGQRDDPTVQQCVDAFRDEYGRQWNIHTRLFPGVAELLDQLSRRRLKLSVLSNKPDSFTQQCVQQYLSPWRFEIVWGQREGVPLKPNPAAARMIAEQIDVPPAEFLYLGDTSIDILTAQRAGMRPVGALWGFRPREELVAAGAAHLIEHPLQLLDLLT